MHAADKYIQATHIPTLELSFRQLWTVVLKQTLSCLYPYSQNLSAFPVNAVNPKLHFVSAADSQAFFRADLFLYIIEWWEIMACNYN